MQKANVNKPCDAYAIL